MTKEAFAEAAHVSRETLGRLEVYADLLRQWQSAVNLVGADTLNDLWRRHMLDSAQLVPHLPDHGVITDFGSGAGFPGLVLSIILDRPVHLVESVGKKAAFLREAARLTGAPATVHLGRIEDQAAWSSDIITARALAPLDLLLDYVAPYYQQASPDACCLFLKGARADEELTEASKNWTMTVERFPSVSDPKGVILRIRDIVRDGPS
ncbi:MAG: 16S rRNA (guanine(527)-N(7))-methyltransferase RsmG [Alphaproteobacteria bacterium]|nr:16S rRNA (guanine(527)-N(7))-methyltransferase RsmG [Alphaproteobacteria bacterium]